MNRNNSIVSPKYILTYFVKVLSLISGMAAFMFTMYYIIVISRGEYHSDCTDTITWAEAVVDGKALINPDFKYACLLPFGGQLLMVPFVAIFGVGMKAQIIGMILFAIAFTAALIYLCRSMDFSYKWCSIAVATVLIVLSASEKLREIFWCHIIYYSLGVLFLMVGLALVNNILKSEQPKLRHIIILSIWTILCSTNGSQALTIYVLPVIAAVFAERFFNFKTKLFSKENIKPAFLIGIMVISMVIGLLLSIIINRGVSAGYQTGYSSYSSSGEWADNFISFMPGIFKLVGISPDTDLVMFSFKGILELVKIIFVLIVLLIPIVMLFMYKHFKELPYRIMILTHTILSVLLMLAWTFGKLNSACWRLSPMLATAVILCVMFIRWLYKNKPLARLSAIAIIPLIIVCITTVSTLALPSITGKNKPDNEMDGICEFLEEQELEYGYATFWNANIVTLLTDSDIKVRCIRVDDKGATPRMYQTNINWYTDNSYDNYFLLLTESEYYDYLVSPTYELPVKSYEYENYRILVYKHNIMEITPDRLSIYK